MPDQPGTVHAEPDCAQESCKVCAGMSRVGPSNGTYRGAMSRWSVIGTGSLATGTALSLSPQG